MMDALLEGRGAAPARIGLLARLASPRLTLVALALLAGGVLAAYRSEAHSDWLLVAPLALCAVNLACAVLTNAVFRRQTALLVFHLALIAIVLLAAAGRLTYLKGRVELSTGEAFTGELSEVTRGPWHPWRLDRVAFANRGFDIHYNPRLKRDRTRNTVSWADESGPREAVIGDTDPLVLRGYRFYTSPNKGFAPLFTWVPLRGAPSRGTVHLPSYPMHEYRQAQEWTPPGADAPLWIMLQFDEVLIDPERPSEFRLPSRHTLVVRAGTERAALAPGARIALPQGTLVYEGLTTWMGYAVFFDPTLPWLLAACLLAAASLAWHFWRKFAAEPWSEA
ncbi:MAG: cytochrome c biogenesis protein ResB [Burkholderiales bacterium]